ncbi:hypothetical protein [Actinosynnema sp. ALI-1.44]|uniref:hypothetical protein n=1 Tax=Actinosynnema sp. ALI-1.44 TaxID=1933779 RepID=UPI00269E4FB4|nr:hypothetical protein [Actinosynnema sp. ALI-1.44]
MRTPHGKLNLSLGLWVQDLGPDGTIVHHNGGAPGGYGALMISTPDGSKTLTATLTTPGRAGTTGRRSRTERSRPRGMPARPCRVSCR